MPDKEENNPNLEGTILSCLNHPGIPRFIEDFEHEGVRYMVQEYINGYPLSYYIVKKKRFIEEEARDILCQLLDILAYLHEPEEGRSPVVHRDLRLSNLVWHNGKVYLIDFGFARHWNGEEANLEEFSTKTDVRMSRRRPGTKTYAMLRKDVSSRSDLFGAGVVGLDLFANWIEDENLFRKPWQDILPASNSYKLFIERLLEPESPFKTAGDALEAIANQIGE
jgi:serine/threonine protein kinase